MNNHQLNPNPWLYCFAVLTAVATLALIGLGGLVTSHGAGMAVPDWPNTYGYNMFLFPPAKWVGGIFYEHTHRLLASGVGLLTTILALWLWLADTRRWLRWLGVAAFIAVVLQGVLGGLRVVLIKDQIGIFHAALAQAFFVLICAIALFTGHWWRTLPVKTAVVVSCGLRRLFLATTAMIFCQLVLGATMRHQHAGLAIEDFPLAHGKLWPDTSVTAVAGYNTQRMELAGENPITANQIWLQMAHRILAVMILICVSACAWLVRGCSSRFSGSSDRGSPKVELQRLTLAWFGLILVQATLGAWTIWSKKAADVATMHVVVGALSLAIGVLIVIISRLRCALARQV